jgi:hypothetical protein
MDFKNKIVLVHKFSFTTHQPHVIDCMDGYQNVIFKNYKLFFEAHFASFAIYMNRLTILVHIKMVKGENTFYTCPPYIQESKINNHVFKHTINIE